MKPNPSALEPWLLLDFRGGLSDKKCLADYLQFMAGMPAMLFSNNHGEEANEVVELESVQYLGVYEWSPELNEDLAEAHCQTEMTREFEPLVRKLLNHWAKMWGYGVQVQSSEISDDHKAVTDRSKRLIFSRHDTLTDAQRNENSDAINKFGAMKMMSEPKPWLR